MLRDKVRASGWQGVCLVAITYVYFLIFAQFAFLKRLASLNTAGSQLPSVMAAMAIGGILFSLLTPRLNFWNAPNLRLRIGLSVSGATAFLSLLSLSRNESIALSFLIGAGLGLLTVTLVTHLRSWTGNQTPLLRVALSTGTGYFACNIPAFFTASVEMQTAAAGLLCLVGIGITFLPMQPQTEVISSPPQSNISFLKVLACFTALVWLDSAAFFIIQKNPELKAGTWQGSAHLWTIGTLHLLAALACAWMLRRWRISWVLLAAYISLGIACLLLLDAHQNLFASIIYPIGVSLYSVALIAYPSLLGSASSAAERGRQAGWLYAIAGWFGSAMGIGMAQNLGAIPPLFVLSAGAVILLPSLDKVILQRQREWSLTLVVLLAAFGLNHSLSNSDRPSQLTSVERGRQIYISEGCINCHSQYVRPSTPDVLMWGPVQSLEELRREHPPLIGNRRQGPDLAEVGERRSPLWFKLHFCNPPEVSGASIMPSYAFLFRDQRGNDLVSYLASLHEDGLDQHRVEEENWLPSSSATAAANTRDGQQLYHHYCATCHDAGGKTRWAKGFKRLPPDLTIGSFTHLSFAESPAQQKNHLARIAKFGIHGTDMPGHEYLSDSDIASITLWLSKQIRQPSPNQSLNQMTNPKSN